MKTKHNWSLAGALTDEQVHAATLADPDAQPLTEERLAKNASCAPREHAEPDQSARACLRAIPGDAAVVRRALEADTRLT